jgi:hypothetical protein
MPGINLIHSNLKAYITMAEINQISIGIYLVEFVRRYCGGGGGIGILLGDKRLHCTIF